MFSVGLFTIYSLFYTCTLNAVHEKGFDCFLGFPLPWVQGMEGWSRASLKLGLSKCSGPPATGGA